MTRESTFPEYWQLIIENGDQSMTGKSELLERMTKQTMLYKNLPERTFFLLIYCHDKQD